MSCTLLDNSMHRMMSQNSRAGHTASVSTLL